VGVNDDLDQVQQCEAEVQALFGEHATANRSQAYYLDITAKDANKGADVDYLSLVAVDPEFGGQVFLLEMLSKVATAADLCQRRLHPVIEVDGAENMTTTGQAAAAIVAGSANFGTQVYMAAIAAMRARAAAAWIQS
jgi:hypothetical protein